MNTPTFQNTMPANPYEATTYGSIPLIPPPPPSEHKYKGLIVALVSIVCLVAILGELLFTVMHFSAQQHTTQVTASAMLLTPTPMTSTDYTATDILHDLIQQANTHPFNNTITQNVSLYAWTEGAYSDDTVAEQSSVAWPDVSSCSGPCDPTNYWLGVYSSAIDTRTAYNQIASEMQALSPAGQTFYPTTPSGMIEAGRCLLLGTTWGSQYAQVIEHSCI